jgi:hypothetical protein
VKKKVYKTVQSGVVVELTDLEAQGRARSQPYHTLCVEGPLESVQAYVDAKGLRQLATAPMGGPMGYPAFCQAVADAENTK